MALIPGELLPRLGTLPLESLILDTCRETKFATNNFPVPLCLFHEARQT
jgi:hypothetical protein